MDRLALTDSLKDWFDSPKFPCLVCGERPMMGFVYVSNAPNLPKIAYSLCADHVEIVPDQAQVVRRIRRILEAEGKGELFHKA